MSELSPSSGESRSSRVHEYLYGKNSKGNLERLARKARWLMRNIKRIGKNDEDLLMSVIRTALRREQVPDLGIAQMGDNDFLTWINEALPRMIGDRYKSQQRSMKHGWTLTSDVSQSDADGQAILLQENVVQPDTAPESEEELEAYLSDVMECVEQLSQEHKEVALLLLQDYTQVEIQEHLAISRHKFDRILGDLKSHFRGDDNDD